MAQQFGQIVDTTELQAFNFLLSAIGEGAVLQAELDTTTRPDTALAKETIINVMREVLSMGWRFNTEWGFEIAPNSASPFTWTFRDATTEQLNIFEPPADLIRFEVTKIPSQQGSSFTDIILRESRVFTPITVVFYNRELQQDGLLENDYAFLSITTSSTKRMPCATSLCGMVLSSKFRKVPGSPVSVHVPLSSGLLIEAIGSLYSHQESSLSILGLPTTFTTIPSIAYVGKSASFCTSPRTSCNASPLRPSSTSISKSLSSCFLLMKRVAAFLVIVKFAAVSLAS